MDLYLMQHGEAKADSEDPARPLTERGRREVEGVARLVVGDAARPVVSFRMGALVALAREPDGHRVRFVLPPELVGE